MTANETNIIYPYELGILVNFSKCEVEYRRVLIR
jgi:hypothetical protein